MQNVEFNIAQIDAQYAPFLPFAAWAVHKVDPAIWEDRHLKLSVLADQDKSRLEHAHNVVKRLAAIESGAIEGLYDLERGLTITIAAQAAMLDASLKNQEKARSLIESQLRGYDYVLDMATRKRPISEAWIRELHQIVCAAQATYSVITSQGVQEHQLNHGSYKEHPNHVLKSDGTYHAYAPVVETAPEMGRLVAEISTAEFDAADPAIQAAYVHHALTSVHPFSDGNGRVARAIASVFTYRAARIPLLIVSEDKGPYFDALDAADRQNLEPLIQFVHDAGRSALDLFLEALESAGRGLIDDSLLAARQVNRTRGGYLHLDIDATAKRLGIALHEEWSKLGASWRDDKQVSMSSQLGFGDAGRVSPREGFRFPIGENNPTVSVTIATREPADASIGLTFSVLAPVNCAADDGYLVVCHELGSEFRPLMRELHPRISMGTQLRIQMWTEGLAAETLQNVIVKARARLLKRGYGEIK